MKFIVALVVLLLGGTAIGCESTGYESNSQKGSSSGHMHKGSH